jgi:hypothetical protein
VFQKGQEEVAHLVQSSAKRWQDYVSFVQVNSDQNPELLSALELDPKQELPALSVEGVINSEVYPMPQDWEIEAENVDSFLQGILEGKATGSIAGQVWLENAGLFGNKRVSDRVRDEL